MEDSSVSVPVYKSGFVAVMGRPNVGKSTLINALLGQKIAAVTPRPQTTRKRQLGILTVEQGQVIFVDTPGVHQARHKLGESMNKEATDILPESDVILFLVDASQPPQPEDLLLARLLSELRRPPPIILALNKADLAGAEQLDSQRASYLALLPSAAPVTISATRSQNLDLLLGMILDRLGAGSAFYPEDQLTDLYEIEIAADLIREAALIILRDEVPHGIAIRIDQFLERSAQEAYIEATLFVEKESHKGIVIGQGGQMLKRIGTLARQNIEQMSGRRVFLQLKVKVRKNWRDDSQVLKAFGY